MPRSRFVCLIAPISLVLVPLFAGCGHGKESFYPSLVDADKTGEITRGWIPTFMPQSARNIHEIGDISPTFEYCGFDFSPDDQQGLRTALVHVDKPPLLFQHIKSPSVSWWPSVLTGDLDTQKIHNAGFELYTRAEPETVSGVGTVAYLFVIDWEHGRAFFYSTPT